MKKIFCLISIVFFASNLWAQKMGATLGLSQLSVEAPNGMTSASEGGYQLGTLFYGSLTESIGSRVGVLYADRSFSLSTSGPSESKTTVKMSYLQVPLSLTFNFTEQFGIFAGGQLNLNAGKSCSVSPSAPCTVKGVNAADVALTLGAVVTFMDSFGAEIYMDKPLSKITDNATNPSIIGINLLYLIE